MSLKQFTYKYIDKCDEIIASNNCSEAKLEQYKILAAFENLIDKIDSGLTYDWPDLYGGQDVNADYIHNITILKSKLESFVASGCIPCKNIQDNKGVNLSINNANKNENNNTNTNTNNISLELLISEAKSNIEKDDSLSPEEIDEILDKINEIEKISKQDEPRNKKWFKMRGLMGWLGTKGVNVATTILPLITEIIKLYT